MPAKAVAILTSDWHLDRHAWAKHPTLAGDSIWGLEQILDRASHDNLEIFAAGDLFDRTSPDSYTVARAIELIDNAGQVINFTQGQHEKVRERPWMSLSQHCRHMHRLAYVLRRPGFELHTYGIDYTRPDTLIEELESVPRHTTLLMLHQVWREFMHPIPSEASFDVIPPGVKLLLTGDFHHSLVRPHIGPNGNRFKVVSPGSTNMRAIDEPEQKFYYILYDDMSVGREELSARTVYRKRIETEQDMADFMNKDLEKWLTPSKSVPAEISKPILDIRYHPDLENIYERIVRVAGKDSHLFLRPIKLNRPDTVPIDENYKPIQVTLEGCLAGFVEPNTELYNTVLRLLKSANPKDEVLTVVEELTGCDSKKSGSEMCANSET